MATKKRKKKKSSGGETSGPVGMSYPQERRASGSIEEAENGFVVRVSSEGLGKKSKGPNYESKTFVATDHPTAIRIAAQGFAGLAKKVRGKKGGKKKIALSKR
jgi:hypothetical protein